MKTPNALQVSVVSSIDEIASAEWDALAAARGVFWTHRFFRALERSGLENSNFSYVLVRDGPRLVGTAVLSSFQVSLDLFLPKFVQRACATLRRAFKNFLRIRVLFCGAPISIGTHTISVAENTPIDTVVTVVTAEMERIAQQEGILHLCAKEFGDRDAGFCRALEKSGFFRAPSLPRVSLRVRWQDFGSYLESMRHGYRRSVLRNRRRLEEFSDGLADAPLAKPKVVVDRGDRFSPQDFYLLYRQVLERASVKLEVLNRRFFDLFFEYMRDDMEVLVLEVEGKAKGAALLCRNGSRLVFPLVGIDYASRERYATYLNLLSAVVEHGIREGCSAVDLGQTSYWAKLRLGGEPEPTYFFLKSRSAPAHALMKAARPLLFPESRLKRLRVFRASGKDDSTARDGPTSTRPNLRPGRGRGRPPRPETNVPSR